MTALFEVTSDSDWVIPRVERTRQPTKMLNPYLIEKLACTHFSFNGIWEGVDVRLKAYCVWRFTELRLSLCSAIARGRLCQFL